MVKNNDLGETSSVKKDYSTDQEFEYEKVFGFGFEFNFTSLYFLLQLTIAELALLLFTSHVSGSLT